MSRLILAVIALILITGATASTGAFTSGDQAMQGVYLNPANTPNGQEYAKIDGNGELVVEIDDLNPKATTVLDSVFTITSTHDQADVWVESGSSAVTFYRMKNRQSIESPANAVSLSENETMTVGIEVDTGISSVIPANLTVLATITTPTQTPEPTTVQAGPPGTNQTQTGTPTDEGTPPTGTPTGTPEPTTETTTSPTPTTPGTTTETRNETQTPVTSGTASATATTAEADLTPAVAQDSPTPTASPAPTPPAENQFEIGGLSLDGLSGLLAVAISIPLAFFAYRWFSGGAALVVGSAGRSGLRVTPGDHEEDLYRTAEATVTFAFTRTEAWDAWEGDSDVGFDGVVSIENTTDEPLVVRPTGGAVDAANVRLLAGDASGPELSTDGFRLDPGERQRISVVFEAAFDPDDVEVFFESELPPE